jgi:RNA polymerase sigma factor (sigma-70 family)
MSEERNEHQRPTPEVGVDHELVDFQTTHWSIVVHSGRRSTVQSQDAMAQLCQMYWWPLYAYVRRHVQDQHQAQDLTQAFFANVLEKNYFADANPLRGRFRAFLLTSLKRFMANQWDKEVAQKRGGGKRMLSLDFEEGERQYSHEPTDTLTAGQVFHRNWARTLLDRVFEQLRAEFNSDGKAEQFIELQTFITPLHDKVNIADVADRLGMTESAVRVAAHRLRKRYRNLLREEISQTVVGPEEVEDEIGSLFAAFANN